MNKDSIPVDLDEAMVHIADPYTMLGVPLARGICTAFGVAFPEHLVVHWKSRADAIRRHDTPIPYDGPGTGVLSSKLSDYIAVQYGVDIIDHRIRTRKQRVLYNSTILEKKLREKFQKQEDNNNHVK